MDKDLYDEFGNLIGDPLDSDAESSDSGSFEFQRHQDEDGDEGIPDSDDENVGDEEKQENRIILQEDKKHYLTMSETFGPDVETIVQIHDNQSIEEGLIKSNVKKITKIEHTKLPKTTYSKEYLAQLLNVSSKVRNISIVGGLNSGKTSFLDTMILNTHELRNVTQKSKYYKKLRYTDNTKLEIERGVTIKSSPITLLLPNLKDSSVVLNIIDTPGHVNFLDEVAIAQRLTDISVVVVDVVEGLTIGTRKAIDNALLNNLQLIFVLNKIDRLILELRLPPLDSYHKLRNVVDEINTYIQENEFVHTYKHAKTFTPDLSNVLFASSDLNFNFSLKSFALLYSQRYGVDFDVNAFAKRLWGDIYYDPLTNKFSKHGNTRSFIHFILEPIYKTVTQVLTKDPKDLQISIFENLGVSLPKQLLNSDPQVLLKETFKQIFGDSKAFVDAVESLNSPQAHDKVELYTGGADETSKALHHSSSGGILVAHIAKIVDNDLALARIFSGTIKKGDHIKILGENYDEDDDEDVETIRVEELYIPGGRYKIPVEEVPAGSIFLIGGIKSISKTGTIFSDSYKNEPLAIFKPIDYLMKAVYKIIIEPQTPSDLPKLLDGLRKINKSYSGAEIKVEESGEHVIFGSGELYLDCLLYDLREITDINIKISDPITKFSETIIDKSFTKVSIKSHNGQNEITIIAEPLEEQLAIDLENGKIKLRSGLNKILRNDYGWDSLAARSLWSFGPESNGPNALLDDTLSDEVDKNTLLTVKDSIIQGFQWAVKEGPLADEPIRNVKFRIIDAKFSEDPLQRGNGQIIPMVRKACYSALLTSSPRVMEPLFAVEIISTSQTIGIIEKILDRRRGLVLKDFPITATQLYKIYALVPVIDSVGLETDIRVATQGQALVSLYFDKWEVTPGDPLDKDVTIPKLRPAPINALARDFVMKTRKRKGLTGEPTLAKYIDQELVESLRGLGLLN